jgi:hypothetical protein
MLPTKTLTTPKQYMTTGSTTTWQPFSRSSPRGRLMTPTTHSISGCTRYGTCGTSKIPPRAAFARAPSGRLLCGFAMPASSFESYLQKGTKFRTSPGCVIPSANINTAGGEGSTNSGGRLGTLSSRLRRTSWGRSGISTRRFGWRSS